MFAVIIAPAVINEKSRIPSVANQRAYGVATLLEQFRNIIRQIRHLLSVIDPTRREMVVADALSIDISLENAARSYIKARIFYFFRQFKRLAEIRHRRINGGIVAVVANPTRRPVALLQQRNFKIY